MVRNNLIIVLLAAGIAAASAQEPVYQGLYVGPDMSHFLGQTQGAQPPADQWVRVKTSSANHPNTGVHEFKGEMPSSCSGASSVWGCSFGPNPDNPASQCIFVWCVNPDGTKLPGQDLRAAYCTKAS